MAHSVPVKKKKKRVVSGLPFVRQNVFRQTLIEDKKGELGVEGRDSNQMKDIRVPGSYNEWGGAMKQGINLVHHFLTKICSCQATLESTNEMVSLIGLSRTYTYIFSTPSFIQFDLDRSCLGSTMGRVNSISSTFINFFLRENIPESKLGEGQLLENMSIAETYHVGSFNNTRSLIVI